MYIYAENFLSYRRLQFTLPSNGVTQITGSNGSGKTAILSIIKWVFFGITDRGGADSVVNSDVGKNCMATIATYGCRNQSLLIERYRKHKEFKNSIRVFVDNQLIPETLDIQERINQELGYDADTFLRSCVFDKEASIATTKDTEFKKFFEKLIGVDFTDWHTYAKDMLREKQGELDKILLDRSSLENMVRHLTEVYEQELQLADSWTSKT